MEDSELQVVTTWKEPNRKLVGKNEGRVSTGDLVLEVQARVLLYTTADMVRPRYLSFFAQPIRYLCNSNITSLNRRNLEHNSSGASLRSKNRSLAFAAAVSVACRTD